MPNKEDYTRTTKSNCSMKSTAAILIVFVLLGGLLTSHASMFPGSSDQGISRKLVSGQKRGTTFMIGGAWFQSLRRKQPSPPPSPTKDTTKTYVTWRQAPPPMPATPPPADLQKTCLDRSAPPPMKA